MQNKLSCPPVRGRVALLLGALIAPSVPAQEAAPRELSTVEVRAGTAPTGYRTPEASGAKTELPLRELPQSVRVITQPALDDLQATRLDDVLDQAGGVARQPGFGGLWDNFSVRGLPGNENTGMATLLNGFAGNRGLNAPRDLAGVERVEFLKGPAAALYGAGEPGGILNLVSKRPRWKPAHTAGLRLGSRGERRATLDSTGPLGEHLAYRLNLALEDSDGFRDFVRTRREVLAPALTWKLGPDVVLEYVGEVLRHRTPIDRGVVSVDGALGAVPIRRFLGEPADGDNTVRNQSHQFVLSNELAGGWRSRVGLSLRATGLEGRSSDPVALLPDGRLTRNYRHRDWRSGDAAVQAELLGVIATGGVEHELLLGMETWRFRMDQRMLRTSPSPAAPYAIDVFNPVYGQAPPALLPMADTLEHQRGLALYLQDVARLAPEWRLQAGLRVEQARQSLQDRRTARRATQDPTAVSPRVGLSWLPSPGWTWYAQAGTSFRPNAGSDAAGRAFEPERGRALELGAKWENADGGLGAGAALFDIRKRNVVTADPAHPGFSQATGAVRSRGVEFDVTGRLSASWRLSGSVALHDVRVTRDTSLEVGGRLLNVPRTTASLLAMHERALAGRGRLGVGGGLVHVGRRLGQARTQAEANAGTAAFELPAYVTAKLLAHWQVDARWRLSLDVHNLFDRVHYTDSFNRLWVAPGAPRMVTVGLEAKL